MTDPSFLDTILIDDHDVRALPWVHVRGIDMLSDGARRGDDDPVFGRDGELGLPLPLAKFVVRVRIRVIGATRGERNDHLSALGPLISGASNGGLVTLKRRRATATGGPGAYLEDTAPGRFVSGLAATLMNSTNGKTELQYFNLKAKWWNGTSWIYP